ncbi:uncharacterized protein BO97DRAFT_83285 [Aspergillus homomorphus CBS 101889]|uniref:Uncharacterized protein n=1 Tax=Aspergillus homomorphus (strain CBS 101889) TaxID=1450537 RepID=A0A395IAM8_ASPHC|nr:hypothetical protein BO97DRAFT_83285 [Aspergillus homomorphus CBS 101889]RAL17091.1 hypothetical protein BO97DRAFT_83285 [Aspergillus homomorphus CBS 101889]
MEPGGSGERGPVVGGTYHWVCSLRGKGSPCVATSKTGTWFQHIGRKPQNPLQFGPLHESLKWCQNYNLPLPNPNEPTLPDRRAETKSRGHKNQSTICPLFCARLLHGDEALTNRNRHKTTRQLQYQLELSSRGPLGQKKFSLARIYPKSAPYTEYITQRFGSPSSNYPACHMSCPIPTLVRTQ